MNLVVKKYEDKYKNQVMQLICNEYSYELSSYISFFNQFYESEFQENALKIIVIDEDKNELVVGFFALFNWPYKLNNQKIMAWKGVNAIVMPSYRGNGIFKKILDFVDIQLQHQNNVDFLIATPLPAAFYGFKKNGWKHLLDLQWFIKLNNPFAFLFPITKKINTIFNEKKSSDLTAIDNFIHQDDSSKFNSWRASYYKTKKYYLSYTEGKNIVQFGVKINIRKKIIRELIVGEVATNYLEEEFMEKGFNYLNKKINKLPFITFSSIAINPYHHNINNIIQKVAYKKINKIIHIVVKDLTGKTSSLEKEKWILYRADLDSW